MVIVALSKRRQISTVTSSSLVGLYSGEQFSQECPQLNRIVNRSRATWVIVSTYKAEPRGVSAELCNNSVSADR